MTNTDREALLDAIQALSGRIEAVSWAVSILLNTHELFERGEKFATLMQQIAETDTPAATSSRNKKFLAGFRLELNNIADQTLVVRKTLQG